MTKECLRTKTGSCSGCNIVDIGINQVRWNGHSVQEATKYIRAKYCPSGEYPDLSQYINSRASSGFGQRSEENHIGTEAIREKPTEGKRVSKKNTGRWFW